MPITPTYPGIYIEEIQSSAHTISAAPTSIAVFVGLTHPFKTEQFGQPVRLFSFADYEREFGGFFDNSAFKRPNDFGSVPHAVNQFFLNGGAECYVVGVEAKPDGSLPSEKIEPPTLSLKEQGLVTSDDVVFTARELTDAEHEMTIQVDNLKPGGAGSLPAGNTADITVSYGSGPGAQVEKFRQVSLDRELLDKPNPNFIESRIGNAKEFVSSLVSVKVISSSIPLEFNAGRATMPHSPAKIEFAPQDFAKVFQDNQPLDKLSIFNLLILPGITHNGILSEAVRFCEQKMAFLIIDPPANSAADDASASPNVPIEDLLGGTFAPPLDKNAALYFPYLRSPDPVTGIVIPLPPAATVAGIFARTDLNRGVWKAPAGLETSILNTTGVVKQGEMTDKQQGVLNELGVNCLRQFPGSGTVVFGARTMVTANPALKDMWRYVPVRRMALFLEQTLYNNLGWVVFEPNDEPLWSAIRTSIEAFMLGLFRQGAFQGSTPSQAFQVKCDNQTTTQPDIVRGIVNIVVAFAPLRPAEFVIIKIAQLAGQTQT
jgi:phage tail sheath protein FI